MRIGIITYHRALNYGSVLQAYALNQYLRNQGHIVETIDYWSEEQEKLYHRYESVKSAMAIARNLHTLFHIHKVKQKEGKFADFIANHIPLTESIGHDCQKLKKIAAEYDMFVCGSDQIWNPQCADFSGAYLLDFVPQKDKCVSYAPSIGIRKIPEQWESMFRKNLSGFYALSARERLGCEQIQRLTRKHVEWVIDPVFLLAQNEWIANFPNMQKSLGKFIFCYFIGGVPGMRAFSIKLEKKYNARRVFVNKSLRDIGKRGEKKYAAGPEDFLQLIANACVVCADSFHAVAFSLIFQKDFWVFVDKKSGTVSSRIYDLLKLVGLENRIVNDAGNDAANLIQPIDYSKVDTKALYAHIATSKEYLLNAIKA